MIRRCALALSVLWCALAGAAGATGANPCSFSPSARVVLYANVYDPDVLVWDNRQRLLDYSAGGWDIAQILLPHALLARAGTRAVVLECDPLAVHPKYRAAPIDALGVKITSGPYRGRYGWVAEDDVRPVTTRAAQAPGRSK